MDTTRLMDFREPFHRLWFGCFFFCIIVFLAVLEKQNQSHLNTSKKMERLIQPAFLPRANVANQIKKNKQAVLSLLWEKHDFKKNACLIFSLQFYPQCVHLHVPWEFTARSSFNSDKMLLLSCLPAFMLEFVILLGGRRAEVGPPRCWRLPERARRLQ